MKKVQSYSATQSESNSHYLPQLDGLRAIAILLVILFHWFPEGVGINILPNGPIGVTLFFVLSGFLITQILLRNKKQIETQKISVGRAYFLFIVRRTLRIFPIYYIALFCVFVCAYLPFLGRLPTQFYEKPFYYLFYSSNFLITFSHNWNDILSPFWSLAVEEQFYLFFPLVLFFVPQKWLLRTIIGFIFLGILSRVFFRYLGDTEGVLTPTCFDTFGLGALWAYYRIEVPNYQKNIRYFNGIGLVGLMIFGVSTFVGQRALVLYLFYAYGYGWVIFICRSSCF